MVMDQQPASPAFTENGRDLLPVGPGAPPPATVARRWTSRRYRSVLLISDAAIVTIAPATALAAEARAAFQGAVPVRGVVLCVAVACVWQLLLELNGSRDHRVFGAGTAELRRVAKSTVQAFTCVSFVFLLSGFMPLTHTAVGAVALASSVLLVVSRIFWRAVLLRPDRRRGAALTRCLLVGSPSEARYAIEQLASDATAGCSVIGVALRDAPPGQRFLLANGEALPVLCAPEQAVATAAASRADAVIFVGALPDGHDGAQDLSWALSDHAIDLIVAPLLTGISSNRVHLRAVEGMPLAHIRAPRLDSAPLAAKRCMDIVGAAAGLLLFGPLLAVLALLIRRDSGPAFFRQTRIGANGRAFDVLKLRTMAVDAEARLPLLQELNEGAGPLFKMEHDPRVTRIGRLLRKYSLDELPQLWNVLRGEMSLVGPRPPLPHEAAEYVGHTHRRLLVKPGMTGLWQVSGRSELSWEQSVRLDLDYVQNWSLARDLTILARTVPAVVRAKGAY